MGTSTGYLLIYVFAALSLTILNQELRKGFSINIVINPTEQIMDRVQLEESLVSVLQTVGAEFKMNETYWETYKLKKIHGSLNTEKEYRRYKTEIPVQTPERFISFAGNLYISINFEETMEIYFRSDASDREFCKQVHERFLSELDRKNIKYKSETLGSWSK